MHQFAQVAIVASVVDAAMDVVSAMVTLNPGNMVQAVVGGINSVTQTATQQATNVVTQVTSSQQKILEAITPPSAGALTARRSRRSPRQPILKRIRQSRRTASPQCRPTSPGHRVSGDEGVEPAAAEPIAAEPTAADKPNAKNADEPTAKKVDEPSAKESEPTTENETNDSTTNTTEQKWFDRIEAGHMAEQSESAVGAESSSAGSSAGSE